MKINEKQVELEYEKCYECSCEILKEQEGLCDDCHAEQHEKDQ